MFCGHYTALKLKKKSHFQDSFDHLTFFNVQCAVLFVLHLQFNISFQKLERGSRGRDRMVVGFITTYTASAYHH